MTTADTEKDKEKEVSGKGELPVFNASGKKVGTKSVPAHIFATMEGVKVAERGLLHEVVRWQRAKKRAGTHSVQTRAEMTGGGVKPWKQKGTGRARAGSNTSPLWVGGGIAHGPKPRSYDFHMNKKQRRKALANALSIRFSEGRVMMLEGLGLKEAKTKKARELLTTLGIGEKDSTLVVLNRETEPKTGKKAAGKKSAAKKPQPQKTPLKGNVELQSLRNLRRVKLIDAAGLNVYDILNAKYVVLVGNALEGIESRFQG